MRALNITLHAAVLGAVCLAGGSAMARQVVTDHAQHVTVADAADGEVKKVDKDSGKLTIKHGELPNLGMGAMTMVFRARDAAMLDKVKAGDKVHFTAENVNGALTVTEIEVAK